MSTTILPSGRTSFTVPVAWISRGPMSAWAEIATRTRSPTAGDAAAACRCARTTSPGAPPASKSVGPS